MGTRSRNLGNGGYDEWLETRMDWYTQMMRTPHFTLREKCEIARVMLDAAGDE
ncbi:hypothetical protein [Tsukamurella strandjordii]|uniref:Uncharacterized protein n=1 Tax=Tsukamurella strandjordii TaxID=147577 RepID=A0AA90NID8_9ACTN|nr:hypothetical protein [Tsukamurella strandjordii]MDP0398699.1 hypothetical protein [Tsukamurella strandjordii]